jgi:hypothetical protein
MAKAYDSRLFSANPDKSFDFSAAGSPMPVLECQKVRRVIWCP